MRATSAHCTCHGWIVTDQPWSQQGGGIWRIITFIDTYLYYIFIYWTFIGIIPLYGVFEQLCVFCGIPDLFTLWLFNSSPWYRWSIEIDGLPIKNGDFPWLCQITKRYIFIWVSYNDLTVLPKPGIMVNKRNHPKMAELFRLVKY